MNTEQMFAMLPGIQPDELYFIQELTKDMNPQQKQQFYSLYQGKRKERQTLVLLTIVGFFGVAGIQRFVIGQTGMGILYLVTIGFCGIGTIIDLININSMTTNFNQKQAAESVAMVRMMNGV
jgi:TM2 domain-containing membrane protein YozV